MNADIIRAEAEKMAAFDGVGTSKTVWLAGYHKALIDLLGKVYVDEDIDGVESRVVCEEDIKRLERMAVQVKQAWGAPAL